MTTRREIDDFLAQKRIAFVGVSRNTKEYSSTVYRTLKAKGYQLYPVNPHAEQIEGDRCYPTLDKIQEPVDAALVMLPAGPAEEMVRQCAQAGIRRVWSRGSLSQDSARFCREQGVSLVDNACPLMFAEPVGFGHACHRFVLKLTGALPK